MLYNSPPRGQHLKLTLNLSAPTGFRITGYAVQPHSHVPLQLMVQAFSLPDSVAQFT
jgi:hypothetical protein